MFLAIFAWVKLWVIGQFPKLKISYPMFEFKKKHCRTHDSLKLQITSFIFFCLFSHASFSSSYPACLFVFILAHINQNLTLSFRSFKATTLIYRWCFLRFVLCLSVIYFMHFYFLACVIMVMVFMCLATYNVFFLIAWSFIVISSSFPEPRSFVFS